MHTREPQLQRTIGQIWADVLGVNEIGPESHFFDLGGHSMLAFRMLMRAEQVVGHPVDATTLFGAPTLAAFVRALTDEDPQLAPTQDTFVPTRATLAPHVTARPLATQRALRSVPHAERIVAIRTGGHKTPVFVLNNTAVLFPLARALGDARPLYALQLCPAALPQALPQRDFRDIARDVVDLMRACQPHGPYVLMGLCVFGTLAMAVADQLREAGETVELLVINDAWAPGYVESLPPHRRYIRAWLKRASNVKLDLERVKSGRKSPSELIASYSILRRLKIVDAGMKLGILAPSVDETVMRSENRWYTDYLLAARRTYQQPPYHGDVLVLRSEQTLTGRYFPDDLGWGSVVKGRLHVMDCPGMHDEMYLPAGSEVMARGIRFMLRDY